MASETAQCECVVTGAVGCQSARVRVGALELSLVRYAAHSVFSTHAHSRPSALVVIDGAYGERAGARFDWLAPGDVLRRRNGHEHANKFNSDCMIVLAMIDARAEHWAFHWDHQERSDSQGCSRDTARRIAALFARGNGPLDLLAAEDAVISEMLDIEPARESDRGGFRPPGWLKHVVEQMHESRRRIPVAELAIRHDLHPSHLTRVFRRWRGCTVSQYSVRLAAQRAAWDLRSSNYEIAGIAARWGFNDQAHLTRVFRQEFGITPARYRAAHD